VQLHYRRQEGVLMSMRRSAAPLYTIYYMVLQDGVLMSRRRSYAAKLIGATQRAAPNDVVEAKTRMRGFPK
jgi:hypothetical protein